MRQQIRKIARKTLFSFRKGSVRRVWHWLSNGHFLGKITIDRYIKNNPIVKIQVGGGKHLLPEWINGDIIFGDVYLNAAKKFPFPDQSVDFIFCEQFLEHLTQNEGLLFLNEAYRILKPGGKIRISTPDLENLSKTYLNTNPLVDIDAVVKRHQKNHNLLCDTPCIFFNDFVRLWGHQFIYDHNQLTIALTSAGFNLILWAEFGVSNTVEFENLDRHADIEWMKNAFQLFCEAEKTPAQRL